MKHELAFLSATEQLSAFRNGDFTPTEVLEAQLELVTADRERKDERINALSETISFSASL